MQHCIETFGSRVDISSPKNMRLIGCEHVLRLITAEFEPQELFNVVQFIMTDREGKGVMTLEEAMQVGTPATLPTELSLA